MRRRSVTLTIEVETVMTTRELKKLQRLMFERDTWLDIDPGCEKVPSGSRGTITQVQVNVIKK